MRIARVRCGREMCCYHPMNRSTGELRWLRSLMCRCDPNAPKLKGTLLPRHRPRSSAPRCSQTVSVWCPGERMAGAGRPVGTGFLVGDTGVARPRRSGYHGFLVDNEGVARPGDSGSPDRPRPLNARCPPWELASSAPFRAQNPLSFGAFGSDPHNSLSSGIVGLLQRSRERSCGSSPTA